MTALTSLPPGIFLIFGAVAVPLLRGRWRDAYLVLLPIVSAAHLLSFPHGDFAGMAFLGIELVPIHIDKLALLFGYIFHIAVLIGVVYALHVREAMQHVAALIYGGAAIAAVFAGDLITLFVFWELTAVASVLLILARRTSRAFYAAMRYLVIQVGSGVLLLAGLIVRLNETGSVAFEPMTLDGVGPVLIFLAFGIKCAFPLLHNWLQDAYPEATESGTVFLSAFTTKLAVYALARSFAGTELLVWIGATMTAFPIFYAVIENDLRRVLAYSLNNQLGFMVVGIGIGTEMSLNGTAAHAFTHILYKALLFMSMGAVLYRVGTVKGSELGGLYKSMPWTTGFCIVGAASISAFPLFSGFVSKALIITAAADEGYVVTWLVLLFASAGVFHHSGIKIPYFAFFAHDSGKRCQEAPANMLVAMAIAAVLCVGLGVFYGPLYALLPFDVPYAPYTATHVVAQLQLLLFSALAFAVLIRTGVYPPELRSTNLDSDWFYRRFLVALVGAWSAKASSVYQNVCAGLETAFSRFMAGVFRHHGPHGILARTWPTGSMVLWAAVLLAGCLIVYYR